MSAVLKRIDDPRSNLEKARRFELVAYAHANGLTDVHENMPAMLIRRRLYERNLTRIPVNAPPLGVPAGVPSAPSPDTPAYEVDAVADLERQFKQQSKPAKSGINELRAECKRLGIKLSRRDNMHTMKAKIESHGKLP